MSLLDLSDELLILIIADGHSLASQRTVCAALRTCRRLNAVATTVLFSRVICFLPSVEFERGRPDVFAKCDQRLTLHPEEAKLARFAWIAYSPLKRERWDIMHRILRRLTSLRH